MMQRSLFSCSSFETINLGSRLARVGGAGDKSKGSRSGIKSIDMLICVHLIQYAILGSKQELQGNESGSVNDTAMLGRDNFIE